MIIINADDWGRTTADTDAALSCYQQGSITSVSAMVFMEDSVRASHLAKESGLDVGLHLNLDQPFTGSHRSKRLAANHQRIVDFLRAGRYHFLLYHPFLTGSFLSTYQEQMDEFIRLYGKPPTHIDGHHNMHLCANMLVNKVIPYGENIRRNFSFWPGEKNRINRCYRSVVDAWLRTRYRTTDYFFSLKLARLNRSVARVRELSKQSLVELMTHPAASDEFNYLFSNDYERLLQGVEKGTFCQLVAARRH